MHKWRAASGKRLALHRFFLFLKLSLQLSV
jgi:hypothetical protein